VFQGQLLVAGVVLHRQLKPAAVYPRRPFDGFQVNRRGIVQAILQYHAIDQIAAVHERDVYQNCVVATGAILHAG
jgi:hypothetical protein